MVLEEGASIGRLYEICAVRHPRLAEHSSSILFSRNREFADRSECLQEGDEVAFLPPVSGGAPGRAGDSDGGSAPVTVQRLTREAIDTRALVEKLKRGEDGAVVVFEGIVRNHSRYRASNDSEPRDRATLYLEYEAYEPMALEKMQEITAAVKRDFPSGPGWHCPPPGPSGNRRSQRGNCGHLRTQAGGLRRLALCH